MTEQEQEVISTAASTAVAILNLSDDEVVQEIAAALADSLIGLLPVKDL